MTSKNIDPTCSGCHKQIRTTSVQDTDLNHWHPSCLIKEAFPNPKDYEEATKEAKERYKRLLSYPEALIGDWASLNTSNPLFSACPVCTHHTSNNGPQPALNLAEWRIRNIVITGATCPICKYLIPDIPTTYDSHTIYHIPDLLEECKTL